MFQNNGHIHVYSPGAGADNPLGSKFFQKYKSSLNLVISCKFFPFLHTGNQIRPCRKIGRKPRVTIYIISVEIESLMLHAKFQEHRTSSSGGKDS